MQVQESVRDKKLRMLIIYKYVDIAEFAGCNFAIFLVLLEQFENAQPDEQ